MARRSSRSGDLTPDQLDRTARIGVALWRAFGGVRERDRTGADDALLVYLKARPGLARELGSFGIASNRLIVADGGELLIPWLIGDHLHIHRVHDQRSQRVSHRSLPSGTITAAGVALAGLGHEGHLLDLEPLLHGFDPETIKPLRLRRVGDIAELLARLNDSVNRDEVVYRLRWLVAQLCLHSGRDTLRTKNLGPEAVTLTRQLVRFLDDPLRRRLTLLSRILVRNLPDLVGKPKVIDRLWSDTIDLSESLAPHSPVARELRRTCHHALGRRTLRIARAWQTWLTEGAEEPILELGFAGPSAADHDAKGDPRVLATLERVVDDLERLLGSTQPVEQIQRWRREYQESLLRTGDGRPLGEHLERAIEEGVRSGNRWVLRHHLRVLRRKAEEFRDGGAGAGRFIEEVDRFDAWRPEARDFDRAAGERELRESVRAFEGWLEREHGSWLLEALDGVLAAFDDQNWLACCRGASALRASLGRVAERRAFPEQPYHWGRLDLHLEALAYLAARHIASAFDDDGVQLDRCLEVIRLCILNLDNTGTHSRELRDLAVMLDPERPTDELLDVLTAVGRTYHRIRRRIDVPFEGLQQRMGLEDGELVLVLANLHRYLHDLNTMAHFADIASTFLREGAERAPRAAVAQETEVVHLSHLDRVTELVERGDQLRLREIWGAKGSGLIYLSYLETARRDGFILPTTVARQGRHVHDPDGLRKLTREHLAILEEDVAQTTGERRRFGDPEAPLLLAVRGGSVFSMPGMLATVLFVGMNDRIAEALAERDPWWAWDCYRRFLASIAQARWGLDIERFDLVDGAKARAGVRSKRELSWQAMRSIAAATQRVIETHGHRDELAAFLDDPMLQLHEAVQSVYASWDSAGARRYRELKGIAHSWHSAVIVQEMVFGNLSNGAIEPGMDERQASLTGVIPRTVVCEAGSRQLVGEIKFSAAGDDLVAGLTRSTSMRTMHELRPLMPMLHRRLGHVVARLRRFMGTDQEVEFTVERGRLSVLQCRTAETALELATDRFADTRGEVSRGLGIRGGGFRGLVAFAEADLREFGQLDLTGRDDVDGILMVLDNPSPEEIPLIISADGLLAAKGGSTSHAAVAIHGLDDRPYSAVMSAVGLEVDEQRGIALFRGEHGREPLVFRKGDVLSIHGTSGEIYAGTRELLPGQ
jgi:hypothetical protein